MSASITDFFQSTAMTAPTSLSAPLAQGASTANLNSTTNYPTDTPVAITFDRYNPSTNAATGKKEVAYGIVSGLTITNLVRGQDNTADQPHDTGAVVEILPTAVLINRMKQGILIAHNQDGTHKAFTESSIVPTAAIQDSAVTNAKVADATLTLAKFSSDAWTDGSALTLTGWSGTPTKTVKYIKLGRLVVLRFQISGTSNSTLARLALPFNGAAGAIAGALGDARDNSVELTVATRWVIDGDSLPGSLQFFPTMGGGNWTASGTKAMYGVAMYEAAS